MVEFAQARRWLTFAVIYTLLLACERTDNVPQPDSDYYPLTKGLYRVYAVQDERYSLSDAPIVSIYFLKETIGDSLTSAAGSHSYKLIRSKRTRTTDSWRVDSVWTIQQWPDRLVRTENNVPYVRLVFPIATGTSWNQNAYNAAPTQTSVYQKVGSSYRIGTTDYANTIQVVNKQNDSTAISLNRQQDIYAYQMGLLFRENTTLAYCQSSPDCIGKGIIAYGYRTRYTLLELGKE